MNKKVIDSYIEDAYEIIKNDIAYEDKDNGGKLTVDSEFKGYISSFGAAVAMGGLKSAIAYFSDQGGSTRDKSKLLKAIYKLLYPESTPDECLLTLVCANEANENKLKNDILDAAIALKLAMKMFIIKKKEDNDNNVASE